MAPTIDPSVPPSDGRPDKAQMILDALPATIALIDPQGLITAVNEHWHLVAGDDDADRAASRHAVIGTNYLAVCQTAIAAGHRDAADAHAGILAVLEGRAPRFQIEYPCDTPDGGRWFLMQVAPLGQSLRLGAVVIHTDITRVVEAKRAAEQFKSIIDATDDAIISKSLTGTILTWNRAAETLFGYPSAEVIGQPITLLIPPNLRAEEDQILARIARGESIGQYDTVRLTKQGILKPVSVTISPIYDEAGVLVGASKIARDITERVRLGQELKDLARLDPVTGLANRRSLNEAAAAEFLRWQRHQSPAAVLMIDIDLFKQINDTYGHDAGDQALLALAQILKTELRAGDLSARYGGDEFICLLTSPDLAGGSAGESARDLTWAIEIAERIRVETSRIRVASPTGEFGLSLSIGVTRFLSGDQDWSAILKRADQAMYQAKQAGRDRIVAIEASPG